MERQLLKMVNQQSNENESLETNYHVCARGDYECPNFYHCSVRGDGETIGCSDTTFRRTCREIIDKIQTALGESNSDVGKNLTFDEVDLYDEIEVASHLVERMQMKLMDLKQHLISINNFREGNRNESNCTRDH